MSVLTIGQIKGEIRRILGNRTDQDTRLSGAINLSQVRLSRLHDFDELRTLTTINTAVTADPSVDKIISLAPLARYRKIYSIRLFADVQLSRKLDRTVSSRWDEVIPEPEYYARGVPTRYTIWGKDQMELWRVPDAIYPLHFRYSRWPTVITDADDGLYLDLENVDDLVIHLTASYIFLSLGNVEKSNEYFKIYAALAKEAIMEDEEEFDSKMLSHDQERFGRLSRGYDDPFVNTILTRQDY
jgi:hypothetical protein